MTIIEIHDHLDVGDPNAKRYGEIADNIPLEAIVSLDPLAQIVSIGFNIGEKMGACVRVADVSGERGLQIGVRALLIYAIEHAAELRDLLR